jgi:hypothetical protein
MFPNILDKLHAGNPALSSTWNGQHGQSIGRRRLSLAKMWRWNAVMQAALEEGETPSLRSLNTIDLYWCEDKTLVGGAGFQPCNVHNGNHPCRLDASYGRFAVSVRFERAHHDAMNKRRTCGRWCGPSHCLDGRVY